ncbi:MAG: YccF domain-containing protein [Clostridia bacterium]|jgi:uncharacterized membrane protein YccF (DUF307 family)
MSTVNTIFERAASKKVTEIIISILSIIFVGVILAILWTLIGVVFCITIVGIPLGKKCFAIAGYAFNTSKKNVSYNKGEKKLFNILWFPFALVIFVITFVLLAITTPLIIFFPNLRKRYKMLKMCFMPFSVVIEQTE